MGPPNPLRSALEFSLGTSPLGPLPLPFLEPPRQGLGLVVLCSVPVAGSHRQKTKACRQTSRPLSLAPAGQAPATSRRIFFLLPQPLAPYSLNRCGGLEWGMEIKNWGSQTPPDLLAGRVDTVCLDGEPRHHPFWMCQGAACVCQGPVLSPPGDPEIMAMP